MSQDEARIGQKGPLRHRWYAKGKRPRRGGATPRGRRADQRYTFAYVFAAVEPGTDNAFDLIMPEVSTAAMRIFLDEFAATVRPGEHVALVLDQAGWRPSGAWLSPRRAKAPKVPACITLMPLPPRSPELNPVERLWLYLKEKFLSRRLLDD